MMDMSMQVEFKALTTFHQKLQHELEDKKEDHRNCNLCAHQVEIWTDFVQTEKIAAEYEKFIYFKLIYKKIITTDLSNINPPKLIPTNQKLKGRIV